MSVLGLREHAQVARALGARKEAHERGARFARVCADVDQHKRRVRGRVERVIEAQKVWKDKTRVGKAEQRVLRLQGLEEANVFLALEIGGRRGSGGKCCNGKIGSGLARRARRASCFAKGASLALLARSTRVAAWRL